MFGLDMHTDVHLNVELYNYFNISLNTYVYRHTVNVLGLLSI